jgi:hypothetical protein
MPDLSPERLAAYRTASFRTGPGFKINTLQDAVEFVNTRGFVFFWPVKGAILPSLWAAVAGDRPVADEHDDPGHVTWGWKDGSLGKRLWYYARILRRRNTLISLDVAPYFYALTENYGEPEEDYLVQYQHGRLTQEAKSIYEALLKESPLDTITLRKAARLSSGQSDSRFAKALDDLMIGMKVMPVGVTEAGAWHYSFAYDLVHRHLPDLPEKARFIMEGAARRKLVEFYLRSVGAARSKDVVHLFGWSQDDARSAIQRLVQEGELAEGVTITGQPGEWLAMQELLPVNP